jgi:hypothetical protein
MPRNLKLIYSPGLITICGLLLLIILGFKKILSKRESFITYFAPKDTKPHDWSKIFSKYTIIDDIHRKRKIRFKLNDDKFTNKKKINLIRYEAQKLKFTDDSSAVILITLTNDVTYGEFISLLDICQMDDHKRFAAFDDKFVIFGYVRQVEIKRAEIPMISL